MVTGEHLQHVYAPQCGDILELSYRKLRKQIRPELAYHMNCEGFPDEEGERALWSFVLEHYPEREMTAMQLAEVYQTKPIVEDETIRAWQGMLSQSVYFEPNIFRLFLFHARTREEVEETLAPKEWTQQEVGEAVREFFQAFPFKKAGYYHDRREVLLTLDFPDAVDRAAFDAAATAFHETTGWKATLNSSMNHASVQQLILSLFGDRVLRYSYYETDRTYRVQLAGGKKLEDQEKIQTFQERTGWKLLTGSEKIGQKTAEDLTVRPSPAAHKMEENAAIAYIRHCAEDWKDALQKVGVKTDAIGRYIELTFMTPQIGARYEESIRTLSEEVGWPLRMNRAVMQNLVLSQASLSCAAHGLELRKNPSFIPSSQSVQLKVQMGHEKEEAETAEEILLKTGLACTFVH
mgnify:CR=1 FL=1